MDAEQIRYWREADRLFGCWLDLEPAQRDAWLEQQAIDADIRAALLALIEQHRIAPDSMPGLESVALASGIEPAPRNGLAGRRIGDWELIEEIGRGGMSVVYRARRLDVDFEQEAAVKLLGLAALGSEGHTRFDQERRLLARLRHPHIAALIDGGFADDGTPFLAMALVEGETLARYCDSRTLRWSQRVRLLIQVCDAVAHAHRNLMVHRDLKPANIMVTAGGVPMLLDFGIAKLLGDERQDTRTGMRALTPGYAAPEQVEGGSITTATDVYALGVILRELCARCGPLPQDLSNIIAMAMREDPARRYPDARALGEDLERLLGRRAVHATPDSTGYRLRAFLRRRRGLVLAGASVALALLVGLGLALWQAQRAAHEADESRRQATRAQAARDFLFAMISAGDREQSEPVDPPVSSVIARGVAKLQDDPPDDPELHAEMAMLLGHLDTSTGQHERAATLLDAALASARRAQDTDLILAVRVRQGILANSIGDARGARVHLDDVLRLIDSATPAAREALLVAALGAWTYAMSNTGRTEEARQRLSDTLARPGTIRDPAHRVDLLLTQATVTPEALQRLDVLRQVELAFAQIRPTPANRLTLASELGATYARLRQVPEALTQMRAAAALVDQVHPGNTSRRARIYSNLGSILAQANLAGEADAAYATAELIHRNLGDVDSPAVAALLHNRGTLLRDVGAAEHAVPLLQTAHAAALHHFGATDSRTLIALRNLAYARAEATADARADAEWRQAYEHAPATMPPRERYDLLLIGAHVATLLGEAEAATARLAEADALAATAEDAVALSPMQRIRRETIGGAALSLGSSASEADARFQRAETLAAESGEVAWSARWRNRLAYAAHLQRHQRGDEASTQYAQALALLESAGTTHDSELRRRLTAATRGSGAKP